MIVDPEFPISQEGDWSIPGSKILSVFRDKEILSIQKIVTDMVDNAGRTVVRVQPGHPFGVLHGNTNGIKILGKFSK